MNEKILIYEDTSAAELEVQGWKILIAAISKLKSNYELRQLNPAFSKNLFIRLINGMGPHLAANGKLFTNIETDQVMAPTTLLGTLHLDFETDYRDLLISLDEIKQIIITYGLNVNDLIFDCKNPVLSEQFENEIRNKYKFWAEGKDNIQLFKQLERVSESINELDDYLKKKKYPALFEHTLFELSQLYFTWREMPGYKEMYMITPNVTVFHILPQFINYKKQNN